jgi:hypothetical protein
MELNHNPIHFTHAFHVDLKRKMIIAEHSDIGRRSILNQLYDDACDVGVVMFNPFTGKTTRWFMHQELTDREGDLQVTIYHPCPESTRKIPALAGWTFHILND